MTYPSIRIEGAILAPDILERLEDSFGQRPADFGFEGSIKVKDEIVRGKHRSHPTQLTDLWDSEMSFNN